MSHYRQSPQTITLWLIALNIAPRFFSSYALETGTICILLFWIAMLVIFSDYVEKPNFTKKLNDKLPLFSILIIIFIFLISILVFFYKDNIYDKGSEASFKIIRWSLYLAHPLICIIWYPFVDQKNKLRFLFYITSLTGMIAATLVMPSLLFKFSSGLILNEGTSFISAKLLSMFVDQKIVSSGIFLYHENFSLRVHQSCSSAHQIMISFFTIYVFYISCHIKSLFKILAIIISSIIIAFLMNAFRISILGYFKFVSNDKAFESWHTGLGSLSFSLFIMIMTCSIYYFCWAKENPLKEVE